MAFSDLVKNVREAYIDRATNMIYTDSRHEYVNHDKMVKTLARTLYELEDMATQGGGDDSSLPSIIDDGVIPVSKHKIMERVSCFAEQNRMAEAVAVVRAFTNMNSEEAMIFIKTGGFKAWKPQQYVRHRTNGRRYYIVSSAVRKGVTFYWCEDAINGEDATFPEHELAIAPRPVKQNVLMAAE